MTDIFYGNGIVVRADQVNPDLMTNFKKVKQFMTVFGQPIATEPNLGTEELKKLRYDLIREEVEELCDGLQNGDLVETADALTDILYVVYGAAAAFGIDIDACFNEVHRSNMSKLGNDGLPIYREDGKVLKGPSYTPPNLKEVIYGKDAEANANA